VTAVALSTQGGAYFETPEMLGERVKNYSG